jgi:hypothetical protein
MADPKLPSAKRRLATLLRDEEYGPKLARLNRKDERIVLDLIYENRGREARTELDRLDAGRRQVRTSKSRAKRYAGLTPRQRTEQWHTYRDGSDAEFWAAYRAAVGVS